MLNLAKKVGSGRVFCKLRLHHGGQLALRLIGITGKRSAAADAQEAAIAVLG